MNFKIDCGDLASSVVISLVTKPACNLFDDVIESSRCKSVPYLAGVVISAPFVLVEGVARLALAIIASPLLISAFCGTKEKDLANVPIKLLATAEINFFAGVVLIFLPFLYFYDAEKAGLLDGREMLKQSFVLQNCLLKTRLATYSP